MNLDPRTVVILTVLSAMLMSVCLFAVARGYLAEMRGVARFATGTLFQSLGWMLLALIGVIPAYVAELGSPLIMLGFALYYHSLVDFRESTAKVLWTYILVGINFFAIYYFLFYSPNMGARIAAASGTGAILMFAIARLLFSGQIKKLPVSHVMMGTLFSVCSVILVVRTAYYLLWHTAPEQSVFEPNIVQDITFLTFFLAGVVSPFAFILMCNGRYNANVQLRSQELAVKNTELEEAGRSKGLFLATMSHELRTPLNGVIGFLNQLGKTKLDTQQREYLQTVHVSSRLLMGVINDILDYSKIEAGKLSIEAVNLDLGKFFGEIVSMFSASAGDKGINLICNLDPRVHILLIGDPLRLSQILSNLIGNAIKFTEKGNIIIETCLVGETENKVSLQISVSDTGIGISEKSLAILFQPFAQADVSTTRKYGGTGLGLTIAMKLAEMMGGRIEVESKVRAGTRFTIHLTLDKQMDSVLTTPSSNNIVVTANLKPLAGKRVLVADDNLINRRLDEMLVVEMGGEFDSVENGAQAVEACSRSVYDLILMDVNMPVMNGLEATLRIRSLESASSRAYIFALTANALPDDKARFMACGMDDYMSKPLNDKAMLSMFNKWFVKGSTFSENTVTEIPDNSSGADIPALDPKLGVELSMGDPGTWEVVLNLMLDELAEYANTLIKFATDFEQLEFWSHKIAGSSCYCGTQALHKAAKQLEINCSQGNALLVNNSLATLLNQIEHLRMLDASGKLRGSKIVVY